MRASGVAAHPAHRVTFPAKSARLSATADTRWLKITTPVGCSTAAPVSNADPWDGAYNRAVRRLFAAVVLVLFASLNAIDGVCCPDGCTHEQESSSRQHNPEPPDGTCLLCLGGVDLSLRQDLSSCGIVTDPVGLAPLGHHLDAPADPLEHPPRS